MQQKAGRKPAITISETDHERLNHLAAAVEDQHPNTALTLMTELDRARVVPDKKLAANIVRMGSTVTYTADGEEKTVTLVYPAEADIESRRISITTPVGASLIGLKEGQSIDWKARNGQIHRLTVLRVTQPAGENA